MNNGEKLEYYSRCFIDEYNSKNHLNQPVTTKYQDTLPEKKMSDHIRTRDWKKISELKHMQNPLQTEIEAFRSVKLCDLEFTRFSS